jgi:large subunit ribosomal protein L10
MLTRTEKQAQIEALKEGLEPAQGVFVMGFAGLTVSEVTELRQRIDAASARYVVVKNTLARIAIAGGDKDPLRGFLAGPTALAYTSDDAVRLAKALSDFAKDHERLQFRGGLIEGQVLDAEGAKRVAALPSRLELVARLLFLMQSPMRRLAVALNWPLRSLAVTVQQVAEKNERLT